MLIGLITLAVVGVGGLILLRLGVRGRRIDDHPVCRRCRFDLVGVYPAVGACPECGSVLTDPGRVRIGQRRKRPGFIALGGVMALTGIGAAGAYVWAMKSGVDLNRHKPVWVLRLEAELGSVARADVALTELLRRSDAGKLSAAQRRRLAESCLAVQGDEDSTWNAKWGDLFEAAWLDGVVGESLTRRYARGAVRFALKTRPTVARGSHLPARLEVRSRVGTRKALQCHLIHYGTRLGDDPADPPVVVNKMAVPVGTDTVRQVAMTPASWTMLTAGPPPPPPGDAVCELVLSEPLGAAANGTSDAADAYGRIRAAPGEHRARARFIVAVRPQEPGRLWMSWGAAAPLPNRPNWDMPGWASAPMLAEGPDLASWRVEVDAPVYVVDAGETGVEPVQDAGVGAWIAQAEVHKLRWDASEGFLDGTLFVVGVPVDLAFELTARCGGKEFPLDPAVIRSIRAGPPSPALKLGARIHGRLALPEGRTTLDIVVRSSQRVAAATLDLKRIWDGEVVIRDVPVTVGTSPQR